MKVRRPVAAVTQDGVIIVVCDDGSVWSTADLSSGGPWTEQAPIPGSQADAEDDN